VTRSTTTNSEGRYRMPALDPGEYEIRAELANFKTAIQSGVVLTVGGTTEADVRMALGPVAEQVTVVADTPLVEPAKTEMSRVVTTQEIESLPISGRNFVDFVKLSSGVAAGRENVGGALSRARRRGGSAAAPGSPSPGSPS
jgi:hypothetical protein